MRHLIWILVLGLFTTTACEKDNDAAAPSTEGGNEGGNESGMLWNASDTADEIVNGLNLVLYYDPASQEFKGTLENLNTTVAPATRVEVHVFDVNNQSTEYGPTPSVDMQPGAKRNVTLSVQGVGAFVQFNMHPEVGSSSSGG